MKSAKKPYVSCIKLNGVPVLPPLITLEEKQTLWKHKVEALAIENKLRDIKNKLYPTLCTNPKETTSSKAQTISQKSDSTSRGVNSLKPSALPCTSPICKRKNKQLEKSAPPEDDPHPETPRRQAIRRNSYTLESPTPEILEHLCALQHKNDQRLSHAEQELSINCVLKIEKQKCLQNLNQMNLQMKDSWSNSSRDAQEKIFMEHLPENFFHLNRDVLSESKSDLYENNLTNSLHLATDLLRSIHTNTTKEVATASSLNDNVKAKKSNVRNVECETSTISNIVLPLDKNMSEHTATLAPRLSIMRRMLPQDPDKNELGAMPYHRHRREWNLKQAKHLWENEELIFPDRGCHSEPASQRSSPLLVYQPHFSHSLDCLQDDGSDYGPVSTDSTPNQVHMDEKTPVLLDRDNNLEKPTVCLESSLESLGTSGVGEDLNLYAYYLNLFKDMSEYVTQQGDLLSPLAMSAHSEFPTESSVLNEQTSHGESQKTASVWNPDIPVVMSTSNSSNAVSITPVTNEGCMKSCSRVTQATSTSSSNSLSQTSQTSNRSSLNSVSTNTVAASDHPTSPSSQGLENAHSIDTLDVDIEAFLLDLQRSQEEEMAILLRKQEEEQRWLKQRQERLKENVLCLSRASSVQSSLTLSTDQSTVTHPLNTEELNKPEKISNNLQATRDSNRKKQEYRSGNEEATWNIAGVAPGSNKSTPSQHYDSSCEEWFTPEADKLSPMSERESIISDQHCSLINEKNVEYLKKTLHCTNARSQIFLPQVKNNFSNIEICEEVAHGSRNAPLQYRGESNVNHVSGEENNDLSGTFTQHDEDLISWRDSESRSERRHNRSDNSQLVGVLRDIVNTVHADHSMPTQHSQRAKHSYEESAKSRVSDVGQMEPMRGSRGHNEDMDLTGQEPGVKVESRSFESRRPEPSDGLWAHWIGVFENNEQNDKRALQNESFSSRGAMSNQRASVTGDNFSPTTLLDIPVAEEMGDGKHTDLMGDANFPHGPASSSAPVTSDLLSPTSHVDSKGNPFTIEMQQANAVTDSQAMDPPDVAHCSLASEETFSSSEKPFSSSPAARPGTPSAPAVCLDALKQQYLLRVKGLHEFETNVVGRLHREEKGRPKSLIRESYTEREQQAALTLTAAGRGFLVRRLLRTRRVQHIKATIQDTLKCALSLQSDPACVLSARDLELHTRLIQQLTAACYELYDTFFSLSRHEQCGLIALDRQQSKRRASKLQRASPSGDLARTKPALSEPRPNNNPGSVQSDKTGSKNCASRVRRSKSVSSQDIPSSRSSERVSSPRSYRVSRPHSTLDSKTHPVPIRRRLVLS